MNKIEIPIEVSARHIHLSKQDFDILFGKENKLTIKKQISQPNQFAANETVEISGPKGKLSVRILGPFREKTQLEISVTDSYNLGIKTPHVRASGDLVDSSGGLSVTGPKGTINITEGVIVSKRHLHIEPELAQKFEIKNNDLIDIEVLSQRPLIFKDVVVRSRKGVDKLSMQIDTDEANAGLIQNNDKAYILKSEKK